MIFTSMTPADIAAAADIEATVADSWSAEGIALTLAQPASRCFVAKEDHQLLGFAAFSLVDSEANLDALSVHEAFRCEGVGGGLLEYAFGNLQAQGAQRIFLEVRSQNAPALALYHKLGFTPLGVRKGFYTKPADDAICMEKEL